MVMKIQEFEKMIMTGMSELRMMCQNNSEGLDLETDMELEDWWEQLDFLVEEKDNF